MTGYPFCRVWLVGLQMGQFRVGTILDPDPFLNNSFGSGSRSRLEPFLLVPGPDLVRELGPTRGPKSSSKTNANLFSSFYFILKARISFNL